MGSITQTTSLKGALVWMGTCDEETCEDFDLTEYAKDGDHEGVINFIYQVGSNAIGQMWVGDQPSVFNGLNGSDDSNTLFCGKCYYIMLNPAADPSNPFELNIPGAKFDYSDSPKRGRIFDVSSGKAQFLGDISQLPSVIAKGQFKNLITDADTGEEYTTAQTLTTDKDGVYIKSDGSVHRFFSGVPFQIPAGSKLLKGKFGVLDTDGDGVPDTHDTDPNTPDRTTGSGSTGSGSGSGSGSSSVEITNPIAAGDSESFVLKADGSLHAAGYNNNGQLGDGTTTNTSSFIEVASSGIAQVSSGGYHTMVLKTDGSLHAFPSSGWPVSVGNFGQIGDLSEHTSGVSQVAAGKHHSMILKSDGSVWTAGHSQYGQLGEDPITHPTNTFRKIIDSGVIKIAASQQGDFNLIVKSDGSAYSFGYNNYGQLGDGTTTNRNTPTQIFTSGVADVAAGWHHSLVLKTDGSVYAFGRNDHGQLATGSTLPAQVKTPQKILDSGASQISAGQLHSLILNTDGSVYAFGRNQWGQLGDGTNQSRWSLQKLHWNVSHIAAGYNHSLLVKPDGSLYGCGLNQSGQLGLGHEYSQSHPKEILPAGSISV